MTETITNPFEIWATFERHEPSGLVRLRTRSIKAFNLGKGQAALLVAQSSKGMLEAWNYFPPSNLSYLKKQRRGLLVWGRK